MTDFVFTKGQIGKERRVSSEETRAEWRREHGVAESKDGPHLDFSLNTLFQALVFVVVVGTFTYVWNHLPSTDRMQKWDKTTEETAAFRENTGTRLQKLELKMDVVVEGQRDLVTLLREQEARRRGNGRSSGGLEP